MHGFFRFGTTQSILFANCIKCPPPVRPFPVRVFSLLVLCAVCLAQNDSRIPPEVRYKRGYVNPVRKPAEFTSAMLWGIAIADTRVPGYEHAQVEIQQTRLTCRVDEKDVILNDDSGEIRGGLYRRFPWFGTDAHDAIPLAYSKDHHAVILRVGKSPERVWHFWAASPRASIPPGDLEGCIVRVRARISKGALLQVGFDYWRNFTIEYGSGGNNHEAGASNWYFPSKELQEAVFNTIR
jgi:hypothetical protein